MELTHLLVEGAIGVVGLVSAGISAAMLRRWAMVGEHDATLRVHESRLARTEIEAERAHERIERVNDHLFALRGNGRAT